jgi:formylglycine-generating enzyme
MEDLLLMKTKILTLFTIVVVILSACSSGPKITKKIESKQLPDISKGIEKKESEEEKKEEKPTIKTVILTLSKDKIDADGVDFVTFSAIGENVTGTALIYVNEKKMEENKFSALKHGKYNIYSVISGVKSNTVSLEALQKSVLLDFSVDKNIAFSDNIDTVFFTAAVKDAAGDIIQEKKVDFYYGNKKLGDNSFKTDEPGMYFFRAVYDGIESKQISVTFKPKLFSIELSSQKNQIIADGQEYLDFLTEYKDNKGNKIQGNSILYMNGALFSGNRFSTVTPGIYKFKAVSNEIISNEIIIKAGHPKIPLSIIETYPLNESANIPVKPELKIKLSQKIKKESINKSSIKLIESGKDVELLFSYDEKLNQIKAVPKKRLKYLTKYTLLINKGIEDITENSVIDTLKYEFTTSKSPEINLVKIKGDVFKMGDNTKELWDNTRPVHTVKLGYSYMVNKYEVTFSEYDSYCDAQGIRTRPSDNGWGRGNNPVVNVSWYDAIKYCNWLSQQSQIPVAYNIETGELLDIKGKVTKDITKVKGYRLLTEAEWEFAALGGTLGVAKNNRYSGGTEADIVAWYAANSGNRIQNIGKKIANELGIYDMSGNAAEWCNDIYEKYQNKTYINPIGAATGKARVVRGGSFYNVNYNIRVRYRDSYYPTTKDVNFGFRIAKTSEK